MDWLTVGGFSFLLGMNATRRPMWRLMDKWVLTHSPICSPTSTRHARELGRGSKRGAGGCGPPHPLYVSRRVGVLATNGPKKKKGVSSFVLCRPPFFFFLLLFFCFLSTSFYSPPHHCTSSFACRSRPMSTVHPPPFFLPLAVPRALPPDRPDPFFPFPLGGNEFLHTHRVALCCVPSHLRICHADEFFAYFLLHPSLTLI